MKEAGQGGSRRAFRWNRTVLWAWLVIGCDLGTPPRLFKSDAGPEHIDGSTLLSSGGGGSRASDSGGANTASGEMGGTAALVTGGANGSGASNSTGGSTNAGGGAGASPTTGLDGSPGTSSDGGSGDGGASAGARCSPEGGYACVGPAQKNVLTCSKGVWLALNPCPSDSNCDASSGPSEGTCQPVVPECAKVVPGSKFCRATGRFECGPDLVTAALLETCPFVCTAGACSGECVPGAKDCKGGGASGAGLVPRTCQSDGRWLDATACTYVCAAATASCVAAACGDGVRNGSETDTDCGGTCGATCTVNEKCGINADCALPASGKCSSGKCAAAACNDGVKNGSETDTDCGGSCGATCPATKICKSDDDCVLPASGKCISGKCAAAACNDGVKNGSETDTDCGGTSCGATCAPTRGCGAPTDCAPPSNPCLAAACGGTTTKVCGTGPAANGKACNDGNACTQSDTCQGGICTGANPKSCTTTDPCLVASCNASTGACGTGPATNGKACSDGNACTQTDTCQNGTCAGSNPKSCVSANPCMPASCNSSTGACSTTSTPDNAPCGSGLGTVCLGGTCTCTIAGDSTCGNACVNEQTDSSNCGACGNGCPSGSSCTAGQCCDPVRGCTPITLGSTPNGSGVGIAVGPSAVYFTDGAGGHVYSCPLSGCGGAPSVYFSGMQPFGNLQFAANLLYDASNGYVYASDRAGNIVYLITSKNTALVVTTSASIPTPPSAAGPRGLATDGNSLYYAYSNGIGRANKATGLFLNEVWPSPGYSPVNNVAIDSGTGRIWGAAGTPTFPDGAIASCDPAGAGCTTWTQQFAPIAVQVINSIPYVVDSGGLLESCASNNNCTSLSVCSTGATGTPDITWDSTSMYYVSAQGVARSPLTSKCGGGQFSVLSSSTSLAAIANAANYVYWITPSGVVQKTTKSVPGP